MHAVATEAAARSVTAACIGRERRYRQKCQPQTGGEKFGSLHHASSIAPCKAESGQPRHTTESGVCSARSISKLSKLQLRTIFYICSMNAGTTQLLLFAGTPR